MLINRPDKLFARRKVTIEGIECTIERKNTRRLNLYIKPPNGEVLVTAPHFYTERQILSFVTGKADWIRKHQERLRSKSSQSRMALDYVSGETLYFWGKPYELEVVEDAERKRGKLILEPAPVFGVSDDELIRYCKAGSSAGCIVNNSDTDSSVKGRAVLMMPQASTKEQREHLIKKRYKELLEPEAERVLALWSGVTGLGFSSWHSRYMKSRWGSLSIREKRVCLNIRLAEKPEICLIYVALHEIAHVKEANHGPGFKAILDRYMPDWRMAEKILKS